MQRYRSLLYVPGNRPELIAKISRFDADAYILDLEDGVPEQERVAARELVAKLGPELAQQGRQVHVRVNPVHSEWHRKDIETALSVGLTRLHIPKVQTAGDVRDVDHHVFELATRWRIELEDIELFPTIETSRAILAIDEICAASPRTVGIVLGADDLTAEWGAARTVEGREIDYVRQMLVVAASAHGLVPIDATYPFHQDPEGCQRDAARARAYGYRSKQAIHPAQCPILNRALEPSPEELTRARTIITAAEQARAQGHGTASAVGTQIDAAVEKSARRLLAWANGPS